MKTIVLKVDVDSYQGTLDGVPSLVQLFQKHQAQATFLFSLGPDHTGWALRRIFRPGFLKKVQRTSVVSHYGLKTLLYGVLLPGPHIGKHCKDVLMQVKNAGFETGIHCYDHIYWQDNVMNRDREWTLNQLNKSASEYTRVFGEESKTHGAAGWQMNATGFEWLERYKYSSDSRGESPFYPITSQGKPSQCLQMPTTLPTMDELLGVDGTDDTNIDQKLLELTQNETQWGHVYTLHAELEGRKLLPAFERFLIGLKKQGYELISSQEYYQRLLPLKDQIPTAKIDYAEIPGRSGKLCVQSPKTT